MGLKVLALQALAATCYSVAGAFMKASEGLTKWQPSLAVYGLFFLGVSTQMVSMRYTEMGAGYIVVLGLEALVALLVSRFWFGEMVGPRQLVAVAAVVLGVALLRQGS